MFVGVDIGGTKINTLLIKSEKDIVSRNYRETGASLGEQVIGERIIHSIREVIKTSGQQKISGIGVAVAGLVDSRKGIVYSSPNIPGWKNFPLKKFIESETGISAFIDNDANLAAVGEHLYGAGIGCENLIYITVSTGIGGGVIINGALYSGSIGTAGEIGHMTIEVNGPKCGCGNTGCWEALASGTAMVKAVKKRIESGEETKIKEMIHGDLTLIDGKVIAEAARAGDKLAQTVITQTGIYLGVGLANLVNIFNPQMIILGGGLTNIGSSFIEPAKREMRQRAFLIPAEYVQIKIAALGIDSGAIGAVAHVRNRLCL